MKLLHKYFKWSIKEFFLGCIGCLVCASAINLFIVPNHLFSGGVTGSAQLLRNLIIHVTKLDVNIDIAGIINWCINIPLFIYAYTKLSKAFMRRSIVTMTLFNLCLTFIPVPQELLIDDLLTNILVGGIASGIGAGLVLQSCSCLGGTDIIGLAITKKNKNASVGTIAIAYNLIVYGISGVIYGVGVMFHSIIYMVFENIMVDRMHYQNISCTATIVTKSKPHKIIKFVNEELDRDCTTWVAHGEESNTDSYITYVVLSKYEYSRLEKNMPLLDPRAFIVKDTGVNVYGKFEKNLTDQGEQEASY
jgi:uncharacterized membrane-anchored protein YitT (DUF2179 family)